MQLTEKQSADAQTRAGSSQIENRKFAAREQTIEAKYLKEAHTIKLATTMEKPTKITLSALINDEQIATNK